MSWQEYQEKTYKTKPQYLAVYLVNNTNFSSVIDLGCGAGNETVYFLKKGKKVVAIDGFLNESYVLDRISSSEKENLTLINEKFESVNLPQTDAVFSVFTLPFCNTEYFPELWQKIVTCINDNGYLVANLFGERDHHQNFGLKVFTKDEVLSLLKDFEIIKWKEQEYTRESDNTHWHYYDFVAQKKENN